MAKQVINPSICTVITQHLRAGYTFNENAVNGYRQTTLANKELGWEHTNQLDLGRMLYFLTGK